MKHSFGQYHGIHLHMQLLDTHVYIYVHVHNHLPKSGNTDSDFDNDGLSAGYTVATIELFISVCMHHKWC